MGTKSVCWRRMTFQADMPIPLKGTVTTFAHMSTIYGDVVKVGEFTNSSSEKNVLVGVVSYGLSSRCQSGRNSVGFYTRIDPYENWIKSTIRSSRKNIK